MENNLEKIEVARLISGDWRRYGWKIMVAFAVGMMMPNHLPSDPEETEEISIAVVPPAVIGKCVMDDVNLNRIESDLIVAQQIAWDWISIEAQCICNSPWAAYPKD